MNHVEGTFEGIRNAEIYYQAWLPGGNVKAVLLVVHGLGEHCGRYMNVINHFLPLGYAVYEGGGSVGQRKAPADCRGPESFVLLGGEGSGGSRVFAGSRVGDIDSVCE